MSISGDYPQDSEMDENSRSAISCYSGLQSSSVSHLPQDQGLMHSFSLNDIFSFMVEELKGLTDKYNQLRSQCSEIQNIPRPSYFNDSSSRENEEHSDILNKKRIFTSRLTDAVLNSYNKPTGFPKSGIQSYEGLVTLINKQNSETEQEVLQRKEQMKKLKTESTQLNSQIVTFSQLLEKDDQENNENELRKVNAQFERAKKDLATVLNVLFGEKSKTEFISSMRPLIEASVKNLECKEGQYVEIPARSLKLKPVMNLIDDNIIVRHPFNKRMYSLCIED